MWYPHLWVANTEIIFSGGPVARYYMLEHIFIVYLFFFFLFSIFCLFSMDKYIFVDIFCVVLNTLCYVCIEWLYAIIFLICFIIGYWLFRSMADMLDNIYLCNPYRRFFFENWIELSHGDFIFKFSIKLLYNMTRSSN